MGGSSRMLFYKDVVYDSYLCVSFVLVFVAEGMAYLVLQCSCGFWWVVVLSSFLGRCWLIRFIGFISSFSVVFQVFVLFNCYFSFSFGGQTGLSAVFWPCHPP